MTARLTHLPERHRSFDLPDGARDYLRPDERAWFWLPSALSPRDEDAAHKQLAAWDALAGRILRDALFGVTGDPHGVRALAEEVAAVAEHLSSRLGLS